MKPEETLNVWMEDQKAEKVLLGSILLQSKINLFKMLEKEERKKKGRTKSKSSEKTKRKKGREGRTEGGKKDWRAPRPKF